MATITPFRYPGAKNKLLSILIPYLDKIIDNSFVDVFVGGGSVLLSIAEKYPKINLYANDKDYWMYCFWKIVSDVDTTWMNNLLDLMKQKPTIELFNQLRKDQSPDEIICAYKAIFFNRTTFSGILTSGAIGGVNQNSKWTIDCRYNFNKLKNKIIKCNSLLAGRTLVSMDDFTKYPVLSSDTAAYLDPPYYIKGNTLYREKMNANNHDQLAAILITRKNWVLSYDDQPEIRSLYVNNKIIDLSVEYCINGKKSDWKKKNELIILSEEK